MVSKYISLYLDSFQSRYAFFLSIGSALLFVQKEGKERKSIVKDDKKSIVQDEINFHFVCFNFILLTNCVATIHSRFLCFVPFSRQFVVFRFGCFSSPAHFSQLCINVRILQWPKQEMTIIINHYNCLHLLEDVLGKLTAKIHLETNLVGYLNMRYTFIDIFIVFFCSACVSHPDIFINFLQPIIIFYVLPIQLCDFAILQPPPV